MNPIAILAAVLALGLLASDLISRRSLSLPIVFVGAGAVLGPHVLDLLKFDLGTHLILEITELTLGVILFADASTLRARRVVSEANLEGRMLSVGLLLSIVLGGVIAYLMFPDAHLGLVLLIAAALAPTDSALGLPIFNNQAIPGRIRQALNVESGLNDGIATPFVMLFISLAIAEEHVGGNDWLSSALSELGIAIVVGVLVGSTGGWLIRQALERKTTSEGSAKLAFLAVAMVAFFASGDWDGNRFVASFVAGLLCGTVLGHRSHETAEYAESTGTGLAYAVWMVFGALMVPLALGDLFSWKSVAFAVLALTVMRMIPVALAMFGTGLRPDTVALMGWFGPRGLASVVFLVTAVVHFEQTGTSTDLLVSTMTWTILLSVILHGITASPIGSWYGNRLATASTAIPEFHQGGNAQAEIEMGH